MIAIIYWMEKLVIHFGERFGRLRVVGSRHAQKCGAFRLVYDCICICGNKSIVLSAQLKSGDTKSCGCLRKERVKEATKLALTTHGMSNTITYKSWVQMRTRCLNKNSKDYHYYGGRGIKVCKRWDKFENFYNDVGERGNRAMTLDRVNPDGDYEPSNCRWATRLEQSRNKRKRNQFGS